VPKRAVIVSLFADVVGIECGITTNLFLINHSPRSAHDAAYAIDGDALSNAQFARRWLIFMIIWWCHVFSPIVLRKLPVLSVQVCSGVCNARRPVASVAITAGMMNRPASSNCFSIRTAPHSLRNLAMTIARNHTRDKLEAGELALGIGLRQARTVDIGKIMKTVGFDWLFIDMEHSTFGVDTAVNISVAAQDAGITPLVRVPGFEHHHSTRVLDGGAHGVVIPHVDDAQTARQAVMNCRYPPLGQRSVTGALPQIDFETIPVAQLVEEVNALTFVVLMIETATALENVEEIAAVPGVDCLLVGTNDFCADIGIPGQFDSPKVVDCYEKVISACQNNGIFPGMGGVYDLPLMEKYIGMGMRFILSGSDIALMMAAGRARTGALREFGSS